MSLLRHLGGIELEEDYCRFKEITHSRFLRLFVYNPAFRYQFYYRLRIHSKVWHILLKPLVPFNFLNLYMCCKDIGGGLFIQHGYSVGLGCDKIGKNCIINQNVTIGYSDSYRCPVIGDNVHICTGAVIIGDVKIGNDVIVGANAVVVKDVPDHSVVAGVPAKIIKTRSDMNSEWVKV